jgi:hypothetical protein
VGKGGATPPQDPTAAFAKRVEIISGWIEYGFNVGIKRTNPKGILLI